VLLARVFDLMLHLFPRRHHTELARDRILSHLGPFLGACSDALETEQKAAKAWAWPAHSRA